MQQLQHGVPGPRLTTLLTRQRLAEPAVIAIAIVVFGCAVGGAGATGLATGAGSWLALGVAAGYALSGST
jgi:hypothetical protein